MADIGYRRLCYIIAVIGNFRLDVWRLAQFDARLLLNRV